MVFLLSLEGLVVAGVLVVVWSLLLLGFAVCSDGLG